LIFFTIVGIKLNILNSYSELYNMATEAKINWQDISRVCKSHKYFYLLLLAIIVLSWPILSDLISDWYNDDNYSHGFLIIPISLYLINRKKDQLIFPARKSALGILVFCTGLLGLILGSAASEYFTTRISFVMLITGLSLYYIGISNFRKIWFAFAFLVFMIPIPAMIYYSATMPMQLFSSKVTNNLLHIIGVNSIQSGNLIYLPNYTLEVTEACSGLRSLMTLMALGALYGYLILEGTIKPLFLFALTVPIAILANIVRLIFTAIGAYAISTELAEGFLHDLSGMIVFISALILTIISGFILKTIRLKSKKQG